jgi:antitoxin MazE
MEDGCGGCLLCRVYTPLLILALERWGTGCRGQERFSLRTAIAWIVLTKVQTWGNSLGVRIPRGLAEEVGLGAGTEVSLTAKDGELVLRPTVPSRLRLADLLAGVTPENIHPSIDTGDSIGLEAF